MKQPRCVIVFDDDVRFIRLVERAFAPEGIRAEPITTDDLDAAQRIVEAHAPLAVLVDIFMYDAARGFDFIERLRSCPASSRTPIVVTSGAARELRRAADWLDELGCEVLVKPFPVDELVSSVLRQQERRRSVNGFAPRPVKPDHLHPLIRLVDRSLHARYGGRRTASP